MKYKKSILFVATFLIVFLVGTVSAMDWDDVKSYDPDLKEYTITNALGLGGEIAKLRLNTPHNNHVHIGFQKVAEIEINNGEFDYVDIINGIELYNINDGMKPIEREVEYKYKIMVDKDLYDGFCDEVLNANGSTSLDCGGVYSKTIKEEKWIAWENHSLLKGETLALGLFTDVKEGDRIEWIINVYGDERLTAWASWTEDLNVDLVGYWSMDDTNFTDEIYGQNGSVTGGGVTIVTGWVGNAANFSGVGWLDTGSAGSGNPLDLTGEEFTWNFWLHPYNCAAGGLMGREAPWSKGHRFGNYLSEYVVELVVGGPGNYVASFSTGVCVEDTWYMLSVRYNTSDVTFFINGTFSSTSARTGDIVTSDLSTLIGKFVSPGEYDGLMDEFGFWNVSLSDAQILQLWNDGSGMTYTDIFSELNVTLNFPEDYANFTNENVTLNCSATSDIGVINITMIIDDLLNASVVNASANLNLSFQQNVTMADGNHNWTCNATDEDGFDLQPAIRHFSVDTSGPPVINITAPLEFLPHHALGENLTVNFTVVDFNLDSCWYSWDNGTTNTTVTCADANFTTNITSINNNSVILYANDSLESNSSFMRNWTYIIFENNQTFDNPTTEGNLGVFEADINILSGLSITGVVLVYNGTNNIGTSSVAGDLTTITDTILIPGVAEETNLSFYWSLVLSNSQTINLSVKNQTILDINLTNCTDPPHLILNFTQRDEELQTVLGSNVIELAVDLFSSDRSQLIANVSGKYETNPVGVCLNRNLTGGTIYSLDAVIKYEAENYTIEYYNIMDLELTNDTGLQDINLYSLNLSDATDFKLTFTGEDFLPAEGVLVYVNRQYLEENVFKTVELPQTDTNGQTVIHLVRNDIVYNLIFIKDGIVLKRFFNLRAFCDDFSIGDCQINLNAISEIGANLSYDSQTGILYDAPPIYNETTNRVTFSFTSSDGATKEVLMSVERRDVFGNNTVCENTVISASGTVSCDIGSGISDTSLFTRIDVNSVPVVYSAVTIDNSAYGNFGYVIWLLMALGGVLLFSDDKNGILIALLVSYMGAVGMGLILGGIVGLGSAGIWIIIITLLGLWRLNKNKTS